jgi:hypothetical protein
MKLPLLRLVGPGLLGLLAIGLIWAGCRRAPDAPSVSETETDEASLSEQQARYDAGWKVLVWSLATREAIADEVIAGRLNLLEAAAGFRAVDQVKEQYLPAVDSAMPGKTAEERLCRQVIAFVAGRLKNSDRRETMVGKLEDDLQTHLQQQGGVSLPEFRRPENIPWFHP